jgi:cell division protein FtsW
MMAIGSGGLTGVGLGSGGSKWYYLPERHTDVIFSVLSEELGFIGGLVVILIIGFIVWRGVMVAIKAPTTYTTLLSIGLIGSLGVQSIVNLGVCTGLLPVTGVTLPFMSYGGTSLVVSMTMIGMLLNISKNSNRT